MKTEGEKSELEDEVLNAALAHSPDSGYWVFDFGWLLSFASMCVIWKGIRKWQRAKTEFANEPKQQGK